MKYVTEEIYNLIEAIIVTWFVSSYFIPNNKFPDKFVKVAAFILISIQVNVVSILHFHWIISLIVSSLSLFGIVTLLFKGNHAEHAIISCIGIFLLALCDICAFTLIGKLLGVDYSSLVISSGSSRVLAVLTSKTLYLIAASLILFFRNKYNIFIHKRELLLIMFTIMLSGIQLSLIRNVIYEQSRYYDIFLIILLCTLLLNIVIYYGIIYIGKKNTAERNYLLMLKQVEVQKANIQALEQKYDETAKVRHDIKNYFTVALSMADHGEYEELKRFLEQVSEEKINSIKTYIKTKRSVIGAVLNSKITTAKNKNINIQCYILSEFEGITDMDVGILLANLLDNAIEACEKNKNESEITVKTWTEAGYYFLEICNTVESEVLTDNPQLLTNKNDNELHGVGLKSVKDIVNKYDGMMTFNQKGNLFHVYVSLEINSI